MPATKNNEKGDHSFEIEQGKVCVKVWREGREERNIVIILRFRNQPPNFKNL